MTEEERRAWQVAEYWRFKYQSLSGKASDLANIIREQRLIDADLEPPVGSEIYYVGMPNSPPSWIRQPGGWWCSDGHCGEIHAWAEVAESVHLGDRVRLPQPPEGLHG